jgi:hypothetical protein
MGRRRVDNILPVVQVPVSLSHLSGAVDEMAGEEEVVLGRDSEGVTHEGCGVDCERSGHLSGDTVRVLVEQVDPYPRRRCKVDGRSRAT